MVEVIAEDIDGSAGKRQRQPGMFGALTGELSTHSKATVKTIYSEALTTVGAEIASQVIGDVADIASLGYTAAIAVLHKTNPKLARAIENLDGCSAAGKGLVYTALRSIQKFSQKHGNQNEAVEIHLDETAKQVDDARMGTPNSQPNPHRKIWRTAIEAGSNVGTRFVHNTVRAATVYPLAATITGAALLPFGIAGGLGLTVGTVVTSALIVYAIGLKDNIQIEIGGAKHKLKLTEFLASGAKEIATAAWKKMRQPKADNYRHLRAATPAVADVVPAVTPAILKPTACAAFAL